MRNVPFALLLALLPTAAAALVPGVCAAPPAPPGAGPWVDCNGDGHVGLSALQVNPYHAKQLLSDALCPVEDTTRPPANGLFYRNDGFCVRESG